MRICRCSQRLTSRLAALRVSRCVPRTSLGSSYLTDCGLEPLPPAPVDSRVGAGMPGHTLLESPSAPESDGHGEGRSTVKRDLDGRRRPPPVPHRFSHPARRPRQSATLGLTVDTVTTTEFDHDSARRCRTPREHPPVTQWPETDVRRAPSFPRPPESTSKSVRLRVDEVSGSESPRANR